MNGQKCWITNGGFADIYTVFAKVDGDKFTGFIIERDSKDLRKDLKTQNGYQRLLHRAIIFQDCKVPVENVLGEIGKGHIIAFNILNIGRLKLCAAAIGGAKRAATTTIVYANTRNNSNNPLLILARLRITGRDCNRLWVCESSLYVQQNGLTIKNTIAGGGKTF
jgi:alkylation response protein AidB-like acyl-CoA dehydrogenase